MRLGTVLNSLYRSVAAPEPWNDFLLAMCTELGASATSLRLRYPGRSGPGRDFQGGVFIEKFRRQYNEQFHAIDPFVGLPHDTPTTIARHISTQRYLSTPYYRQFQSLTNTCHILGMDLTVPDGTLVRLRVTRLLGAPDFDEEHLTLCRRLPEHLGSAVLMYERVSELSRRCELYADTAARAGVGVLALDDQRRVIYADDTAEDLLTGAGHGTSAAALLALADRSGAARLADLVTAAAQKSGTTRSMCVASLTGTPPLALTVRRTAAADAVKDARTIVLVGREPEGAALAPDALMERFGLTRAEAVLCFHLASGRSLDETAELLHVSRHTVRTHLRSVYSKVGVSRQAALVSLMMSREP